MMYDSMYIQNRILDKNRDFEAIDTIVAGNNVRILSSENHIKHINTGDVVIKNGATVNFKAGESIHLSQGFRVESGANFHAYLDSEMKRDTKESNKSYFRHTILGNKNFADTSTLKTDAQDYESIEWQIKGDNFDESFYSQNVSLENLTSGQYSVFCIVSYPDTTTGVSDIVISRKLIETTTEKENQSDDFEIIITPNPANDIISINIKDYENPFDVIISSSIGETILHENNIRNGEQINTANLLPGIYQLTLKSENHIWYEKFIKN